MNDTLRIINLSNYAKPEVKIRNDKDWVTFGKNNDFFGKLIDRTRGSVTNGAAVKSISRLIYGRGLTASNKSQFPNHWAKLLSLLSDNDVKRVGFDLYATGNCALEVIYDKKGEAVVDANHVPIQCLAPQKAVDGEILNYYYAWDWSKVRTSDDVEEIPAFGTKGRDREILYIKEYDPQLFYFSLPVWFAAYQWAELEEEIANYHLNNIQNGLAPSMFISLNNGKPESSDEADQIVRQIERKYTGSSNAGRIIVQFSDGSENASTITPIPLSDASEQYQFLSDESGLKIIQGHRIPSPALLGIPVKGGFSSTSEELKTASILLEAYVINPQRQLLIEGFDKILAVNGSKLKIEFESLNPFAEEEAADIDANVEMSLSKNVDDEMFSELDKFGEEEDLDNWELIDEREVDYDEEENLDKQITNLASTGTARPNAKSEQDGETATAVYKVRYQYAPLKTQSNSREFCKKMVSAKKIYRKEDIVQMENKSVNKGWGLNGADTYSIWLYKGGGGCHHKWFRKTYKLKEGAVGVDINSPNADTISTTKARSEGFKYQTNDDKVAVAPKDMPNGGFVNKTYKK